MIEIPKVRTCVIYCIWNNANDNIYVGSTKDFRHRILTHLRLLRANKHHSKHLQNAWNKYGEESFELITLKESSLKELLSDEQWCLDILRPVYNSCKTAGNTSGLVWDTERREKQLKAFSNRTESHRKNISNSLKKNKDFVKISADRCKIMSNKNKKSIEVLDINNKVLYTFNSIKEASEKLNVSKNNINSRLRGIVKSAYNKMYKFKYK